MTIIASTLFLAAIALSIFVIFGSIAENMPRILEVIEDRHVAERQTRTITVGLMRTTSVQQPVNVIPIKLRKPIAVASHKARLNQSTTPAMRLPLAA